MKVIKRNGTIEDFNFDKIITAVNKSANRIGKHLTCDKIENLKDEVVEQLDGEKVTVERLHQIVELSLSRVDMEIADSYRGYRNWVKEKARMMTDVENAFINLTKEKDRSNANTNSDLFSFRRTSASNELLAKMLETYFLTKEELQACHDGLIYIHDKSNRLIGTHNCAVFRMADILKGGFYANGYYCKEPKNIKNAIGCLVDLLVTMCNAQYGGGSVNDIDIVLGYYCEKTVEWYIKKGLSEEMAIEFTRSDLIDGIKAFEYRVNITESSRGDYSFTTISFGRGLTFWEREVSKAILEVRQKGHGDSVRQIAIFPKLVFIRRTDKQNEDLFDMAIKCSSKCLYPDYIRDDMVTPMGCRSFMEDSYDENGNKILSGKGNIGVISLNIAMIYMYAKDNNIDFFDELARCVKLCRDIHYRTYELIGKQKAKSNPIFFTQGGAYGGYLDPEDNIAPLVNKYFTASIGITALNELTRLHNGKSILEDNSYAIEVCEFIKKELDKYREQDNRLYSMYGTPAESLATRQCTEFREKYGIIKDVSDRMFFTNSFHCHVSEEISPFEKQDAEEELFHIVNGGHIQYVRISNPDNLDGIKAIVERGLEKKFYEGVNINCCTCEVCGHQWGNDNGNNPCPECGSNNVTEINRNCGYISYSRKRGDRTVHDGKLDEIRARVSM